MPNDTSSRRRILLVDPFFGVLGGGVIVSAWIAQTLSEIHDVTWLTWRGADLARLDRFAGTRLARSDLRVRRAPVWMRAMGETLHAMDRKPYGIQRWALLMGHARRLAQDYDLAVGCADEVDLGPHAIQYVHYPYLEQKLERSGDGSLGFVPGMEKRPWARTSGFDPARFAATATLTNSDWTGERIRRRYGIAAETVYPPVPGDFAPLPWDARDKAVICVGRIAAEKDLPTVVEIVARARRNHPDLRLRIAGATYSGPSGAEAMAFARQAARTHDWIDLHLDLSRADLVALMCRSRFGLHAMRDEHFGISIAEIVRAGAAMLVHDSGGQVEIVNRDPRLIWRDPVDAAAKLSALLSDEATCAHVRAGLAAQAARLTTSAFSARIRAAVDTALAARKS